MGGPPRALLQKHIIKRKLYYFRQWNEARKNYCFHVHKDICLNSFSADVNIRACTLNVLVISLCIFGEFMN